MISKEAVIEYYADKANGVHRHNTEEFFQAEAKEKLFHMGRGEALLDFGCGTADLLAYYAPHFDRVVGVDISDNMVARARARLAQQGIAHAVVSQADEDTVWPFVAGQRFDVITSAGVMQYLSGDRIERFLASAKVHLNPAGRVAMFDLIDPRLYWLFKYGWFSERPLDAAGVAAGLRTTGKVLARKLVHGLRGQAEDHIGHTHHPRVLQAAAAAQGYRCTIVSSMYYEYRYHALMSPLAG